MKAQIPNPCPAKWEDMKIGQLSRHCFQCQKDVVDFTQFTREEILNYLLENRRKSVCGRAYPEQLDFSHTQPYLVFTAIRKRHFRSQIPIFLLAAGVLSITSCEAPENRTIEDRIVEAPIDWEKAIEKRESSVDSLDSSRAISCTKSNPVDLESLSIDHIEDVITTGIMIAPEPPNDWLTDELGDVDLSEEFHPHHYAEVMPEFKFGNGGLNDYLKQNLKYPDQDRKMNVEGMVWVSFIVDRNGSVNDIEIEGMKDGSKRMEAEVLRLFYDMPSWIPGENGGDKVDVRMVIPIKFKLDPGA
ncbi:energy transducer TonB [bacterium SCSIO 12741]|nr:energy transducer TonB [bacterium SCSIO 12741]